MAYPTKMDGVFSKATKSFSWWEGNLEFLFQRPETLIKFLISFGFRPSIVWILYWILSILIIFSSIIPEVFSLLTMEATPLQGEKPRGLSVEDKQLKERFSHPIPGTGVYLDSPPALHETAPS